MELFSSAEGPELGSEAAGCRQLHQPLLWWLGRGKRILWGPQSTWQQLLGSKDLDRNPLGRTQKIWGFVLRRGLASRRPLAWCERQTEPWKG